MEQTKKAIEKGDPIATNYFKEIKHNADYILTQKPYSVTFKSQIPPSGDKHDYISIGPYWWPDSSKPDGIPYIRKDGHVNPKRSKYSDPNSLHKLNTSIHTLGIAYYITNDDKYVICANKLLYVFFIDPKTRMNPNLNFGQFVPGMNQGRQFGIIETTGFRELLEGVALLSDSKSWSQKNFKQLKLWMRNYLNWLTNSSLGIKERNARNNHGTHYDEQCIAISLFIGNVEETKKIIKEYTIPRLESHIKPDGSQPNELSRTKSWNYTNMNLDGFVKVALMAEKIDIDLWHYQKNGQTYIKSMIDWFIPYLRKEKLWKWKQIHKESITRIQPVLELAADRYDDDSYMEVIKNFQTIHENIVF